jgi:transcriptional regulator with XRE-family HTH domain
MPTLRRQFGLRLRQIRLERGMTQERFAEKVGVSVDFLSLIERGINAPSFPTLERFSKHLKMSVSDLFRFDVPNPKNPSD